MLVQNLYCIYTEMLTSKDFIYVNVLIFFNGMVFVYKKYLFTIAKNVGQVLKLFALFISVCCLSMFKLKADTLLYCRCVSCE